ncbi:hypothetical protein D3C73_1548810 [compost metagenome]
MIFNVVNPLPHIVEVTRCLFLIRFLMQRDVEKDKQRTNPNCSRNNIDKENSFDRSHG